MNEQVKINEEECGTFKVRSHKRADVMQDECIGVSYREMRHCHDVGL